MVRPRIKWRWLPRQRPRLSKQEGSDGQAYLWANLRPALRRPREGEKMSPRTENQEGDTMRTTRILLAIGCFVAIALGTLVSAKAQYYYPPPNYGPPPGYGGPPPGYGGPPPGYGYRTYNGCPPGYTIQGGNCAPYQGPVGGGYYRGADPNGCPPGYSLQGGNCAPYQGPRGWYVPPGAR
jgi:hypothetical protein